MKNVVRLDFHLHISALAPTVILGGRLLLIQFIRMQAINLGCVAQRCTALDAMHFIALAEQKLGKVRPVLFGGASTHARLVIFFILLYFNGRRCLPYVGL